MNKPDNRQFVELARAGQPASLTGETSLQGILTPSNGPPPTVRLDVTWPGRSFSSTQEYELSAVEGSTTPDACAPG